MPDVEVKFSGYGPSITALTVSRFTFWNGGNETINKQDIVKEDPLRVQSFGGAVILSVSVVGRTTAHNNVECTMSRERNDAPITFSYLDGNEGAVIQVFHTGSDVHAVQLRGTIKGAGPITKPRDFEGNASQPRSPRWLRVIQFISTNVMIVGNAWVLASKLTKDHLGFLEAALFGLIILLALGFNGLYLLAWYFSRVPRSLSRLHVGQ